MNGLIFGATSAIAEATARAWIEAGWSLFLVGRTHDKLQAIYDDLRTRAAPSQRLAMALADLTELGRHPELIAEADAVLGGLDLALIAHGSLPVQADCERSVEDTMRAITTNALSVISLLSLLANYFEARRHGTLVTITSVAGDRGRSTNYVYGAAKGMVSIFLGGLRQRLARSGVSVVTVKPGLIDTPMTRHLPKTPLLWAEPEAVAKAIVRAVDRRRDVVYVPRFWRYIMFALRMIPESIFKRLNL